ncbi:MAG TPA: hypothetical protein VHB02_04895 [Acidimicrobiales bacterium]|nr:hypothetical protein [Acidimicrobiales bacterium]
MIDKLRPYCDYAYVCDISLRDGTELSVVLVGISSTTLVLDRWDDQGQQPAGDPFTLDLATIQQVVIP